MAAQRFELAEAEVFDEVVQHPARLLGKFHSSLGLGCSSARALPVFDLPLAGGKVGFQSLYLPADGGQLSFKGAKPLVDLLLLLDQVKDVRIVRSSLQLGLDIAQLI